MASIVAKVTRDRLMRKLDAEYPAYGFARHKGYATPKHLAALDRWGPCPIHWRSFSGDVQVLIREIGEDGAPLRALVRWSTHTWSWVIYPLGYDWPSADARTPLRSAHRTVTIEGPFGTAHDLRTPPSSRRKSQCSRVALCSWTTKRRPGLPVRAMPLYAATGMPPKRTRNQVLALKARARAWGVPSPLGQARVAYSRPRPVARRTWYITLPAVRARAGAIGSPAARSARAVHTLHVVSR